MSEPKPPATVPATIDQATMMALMGKSSSPALMIILNDGLFERCKEMARIMAAAEGATPAHLIGKREACFSVVNMALIWKLAPQMVAGATFTVGNKLGYEGKLIQAILENSGKIIGTPKPEYFGDWSKVLGKFTKKKNDKGKEYAVQAWKDEDEEGLGVIVRAQVEGEVEPREFEFLLKQAFPRNSTIWATDPKTQLWYTAIRRFANVAAPGILMGVPFDRDETMAMGQMIDITPEDEPAPRQARPSRAAAKKAAGAMDNDFKGTVGAAPPVQETVIEEDDGKAPTDTAADQEDHAASVQGAGDIGDGDGDRGGNDPSPPETDDFAGPPVEGDEDGVVEDLEETAPTPPPKAVEPPKPAPAPKAAAPKPAPAPAAPPAPKPAAAPSAAPATATITEAQAKEIQKKAETEFTNAMTLTRLDEKKGELMPEIGKLKVAFPERHKSIVAAYQNRQSYLKKRSEE